MEIGGPRMGLGRILGSMALLTALACGGEPANEGAGDTAVIGATPPGANTGAPGGALSDSAIFAAMVAANAAEIQAGQLASDSAANPQVRQYAQMMVTDHRTLNDQAHQAAQQANIASHAGARAEEIGEMGRELMQNLQGKRGAEFDRAFVDGMVRSHEQTLELLNRAGQSTTLAAPLQQAITQSRQKVQQHLDQARQLQSRVQQGS